MQAAVPVWCEFEVKGTMEEKTREMVDLMVLPRPAKSMQNGADYCIKTTGPTEKKGVALMPPREQLASTQVRLCQKEK